MQKKNTQQPILRGHPRFKLSDLRSCEGFNLHKAMNCQKIVLVGALATSERLSCVIAHKGTHSYCMNVLYVVY